MCAMHVCRLHRCSTGLRCCFAHYPMQQGVMLCNKFNSGASAVAHSHSMLASMVLCTAALQVQTC